MPEVSGMGLRRDTITSPTVLDGRIACRVLESRCGTFYCVWQALEREYAEAAECVACVVEGKRATLTQQTESKDCIR